MVRAIHTSVKGRARYKIKGLHRSESLKKHIEFRLAGKEGISRFSVNALTGNILVFFNSNNDVHTIAALIEGIVVEYSNEKTTHMSLRGTKSRSNPIGVEQYPQSAKHEIASSPIRNDGAKKSIISRRKVRRAVIHAGDQMLKPWHLMEASDIIDSLETSKDSGLSLETARERLKKYGPNILPESVPRSGFSIFTDQFKSLPVALLGVAAGISILTGGIADALVIMGVVTINAAIGYVTESQAEKTIHSLKSLVRPSALVVREGSLKEIGAEDIVPGDILVLRPGSYVAADARLIEAHHLGIDESALTGESMPVVKSAEALKIRSADVQDFRISGLNDIPLADRTNMVYMGTLVTGGQGIAVVVATGKFTEIGKIQTLVGEAKPPETPMERQLNTMGSQLVLIGGAVCGVVFLIGLIRGYGFLQMLKTSISLAVAAVPEGLPTVATTTLALGIRKMRKHNVLIRHLEAVETLGSVQTICLDKTGTITMNRMSVVAIYTGMKRIEVSDGKFIIENSRIQGVRDSGEGYSTNPRTLKSLNPYYCDELLRLIHISVLCNESEVSKLRGEYVVNGSPTENSLIHLALSSGVDVLTLREKFPSQDITHRSENRNYMCTRHRAQNKSTIIAIKGSPNEVLSLCTWYMKEGKKMPLTEEERLAIKIENEHMAGKALRVLGIAYAFINEDQENLPPPFDNSTIHPLVKGGEGKGGLIWLGLVGMTDPLRSGVKKLIAEFHKAGIDTVMITGDQSPTAYAI